MRSPESDAPGQLHFHYDKGERTRSLSEYAAGMQRPRGFFRKNRGLAIVLLDTFVLVVLFVIISVFQKGSGGKTLIADLEATLRAVEYGDRVLVTLTLTAGADGAEGGLTALFRYESGPERALVSTMVPNRAGATQVLREALSARDDAETLFADITTRGETVTIETPVVRE